MHLQPGGPGASADPRVAVVVTVFNKASFVAGTLQSVMGQTYPEVELIIVDDGSTDGSPEIVRGTLEDYPVHFITLANGGVSRARNVGASAASEEARYLLFLDADDVLAREAIAELVDHLERHPEAAACYCRLQYVDPDGVPLDDPPPDPRWGRSRFGRRRIPEDAPDTPLEAIWSWFCAIPSCSLIRRSAFTATSGFDRTLCPPASRFTAEDKDMAIQLALQGEVHRLPQRLVEYRVMPSTHKDALFEGLKVLNTKWWSAGVSDEVQIRVRSAIRFDYRVAALDALEALGEARGRGTGELLVSGCRLLRASARYALAGTLLEHRSRSGVRRTLPRAGEGLSADQPGVASNLAAAAGSFDSVQRSVL